MAIRVIRKSVWETNSSSSHAVVIDRNDFDTLFLGKDRTTARDVELNRIKDNIKAHKGKLKVILNEYGWEYDLLTTFEEKLAYVITSYLPSQFDDEHIYTPSDLYDELDYSGLLRFLKEAFGVTELILRNTDYYGVDHNSKGFIFDKIGLQEDFCEAIDSDDNITKIGQRLIDFLTDPNIYIITDSERFYTNPKYVFVSDFDKLDSEYGVDIITTTSDEDDINL